MPKIVWMFIAGALVGTHYGFEWALGLLAVELAASHLTGFFSAMWADIKARRDKTPG